MSQHFQRECARFLDDITCKIKKDRKEFKHLICPITDQIMIDPVIASDHKTYERCTIAGAYQRGDTVQPLTERCPNYMAKDMIAAYKRGTVYLLQPQKFLGTYVLKLGDSKHIDLTREKQYGKNTDIIYHVQCDYYWLVEKALKDEFNRHFECVKIEKNGKMLPTKEYFRGNLQDMQDCWISVVSKIVRRHRSLDKQINVYASRESEPVVVDLVVDSSGDDDTSMGPEYALINADSRLNLQQTMRQQFNSSSDGDTPGDTSETPLSDSPADSKRQRVGSESEDESPQNKKLRRSCVGCPDYSHSGQHLLHQKCTESDVREWYNEECEFVEDLHEKTTKMADVKNALKRWLEVRHITHSGYTSALNCVLNSKNHVASSNHGQNINYVHKLKLKSGL